MAGVWWSDMCVIRGWDEGVTWVHVGWEVRSTWGWRCSCKKDGKLGFQRVPGLPSGFTEFPPGLLLSASHSRDPRA